MITKQNWHRLCMSFTLLSGCSREVPSSHTIILLSGTSSSGKSTIARTLQKELGSTYEIVALDDFMDNSNLLANPNNANSDVNVPKAVDMLCQKIKKISAHKNVIVDTVFGLNGGTNDGSYEKFFDLLHGQRIISVLVYCPLDVAVQRAQERNVPDQTEEHRDAMSPFVQFPANYRIKSFENDVIVDTINTTRIKSAIKEAMLHDLQVAIKQGKMLPITQEEIEKSLASSVDIFFNEKFVEQLGWSSEVEPEARITPRYHHDLIIKSGVETPDDNVQHIIKYLHFRDKVDSHRKQWSSIHKGSRQYDKAHDHALVARMLEQIGWLDSGMPELRDIDSASIVAHIPQEIRVYVKAEIEKLHLPAADLKSINQEIDQGILRIDQQLIYVYHVLNDPVAFVRVFVFRQHAAVIARVDVLPEYRRLGIGEELLRYTLNQLDKMGICTTILGTEEQNTNAQKLYKKVGFIGGPADFVYEHSKA